MSLPNHKLCISLLPQTPEQLKEWLSQSQEGDVIEIRLDHLPDIDFKQFRALSDKPLIATLRSRDEGGFWDGSPEECIAIYQSAIDSGIEYVDVEFTSAQNILPGLDVDAGRIILSHHSPQHDYSQLKEILQQMLQTEAGVYKLIFRAASLRDNLTALKLINDAAAQQKSYVIHAMGDAGQLSRLLGAIRGNAWTYVARDFTEETASGQLTFHEAKHYYFLPQKTSQTKLLGLVGSPIQQSKGWQLHNALIDQKVPARTSADSREDYLYVNFPADDLDEFWPGWQPYLHGLSITLPYKEKIVDYLGKFSAGVKISGVCNTVVKSGDDWIGYNTDLYAIETLLRPYQDQLKSGGMIIGTGATARSAIAALKRLEVNPIFVSGRNTERGRFLVDTFGVDFLAEDEIHYASAAVIVQTTPVGMVPYTDKYPVGTALFRRERIVLDVIYNPEETRFLKIARERGCIAISGVEMFLFQAARQFEIFTGEAVSREEIRKVWDEIV